MRLRTQEKTMCIHVYLIYLNVQTVVYVYFRSVFIVNPIHTV